jgi:chemotaxis response regulator CheB
MTGMGDDGACGMLELKEAGAHNIAQDEASRAVFGMPAEAIKLGGVDNILPLDRIAGEVAPTRPLTSHPKTETMPRGRRPSLVKNSSE